MNDSQAWAEVSKADFYRKIGPMNAMGVGPVLQPGPWPYTVHFRCRHQHSRVFGKVVGQSDPAVTHRYYLPEP